MALNRRRALTEVTTYALAGAVRVKARVRPKIT